MKRKPIYIYRVTATNCGYDYTTTKSDAIDIMEMLAEAHEEITVDRLPVTPDVWGSGEPERLEDLWDSLEDLLGCRAIEACGSRGIK